MIHGLEVAGVWVDEVSDASERVGATLNRKVVVPLDIVCRSCGAEANQRCTDTFRGNNHERKPHRRRKTDASLVQQAARAMLRR